MILEFDKKEIAESRDLEDRGCYTCWKDCYGKDMEKWQDDQKDVKGGRDGRKRLLSLQGAQTR